MARARILTAVGALTLTGVALQQSGFLVGPRTRAAIVRELAQTMASNYVFRPVGKQIEQQLIERLDRGDYNGFPFAFLFGMKLTSDLRVIAGDLHLRVAYSIREVPREELRPPTKAELAREAEHESADNFGFVSVKTLPSRIGYIEIRRFAAPEWAAGTLESAMDTLADSGALIIDLRENRGGSPHMGLLLASYFFEMPVHYVTLQFARGAEELWTAASVPGRRYIGKPVYILISSRTFSAAEGFAYHMRNLGRASLVGERTRGGANPGARMRISDHFTAFVPTARAVSPITGTNWDGSGVAPDYETSATQALSIGAQIYAAERRSR